MELGAKQMNELQSICELLVGRFDNRQQVEAKREQGDLKYPEARHINTICNDKINNLPTGFEGAFLLEESYYTVDGNCNAMPHLFLLSQNEQGVELQSFDMPEGYTKDDFSYEKLGTLDYNNLKRSEKFTPIVYRRQQDGSYYGKSESMFSPVLKFTLEERFSKEMLEVSEIFEVNGRRTFGYDDWIEYVRVPEK